MYNCLILGSGRSGTSMVAGALAGAGYFMGNHIYKPRAANPKGFFEDAEVNSVNEAILSAATLRAPAFFRPTRLHRWLCRSFFPTRIPPGENWLARIQPGASLPVSKAVAERISLLVQQQPFCLKDPRFCYTLAAWRPWLKNTRFVCIFRQPAISAFSMEKEVRALPRLSGLRLSRADYLEIWRLMYSRILEVHILQGEWLFLHYDQVLAGSGLDRLAVFLQAVPDKTFPDSLLRRSKSDDAVSEPVSNVYEQLCRLASFPGKNA